MGIVRPRRHAVLKQNRGAMERAGWEAVAVLVLRSAVSSVEPSSAPLPSPVANNHCRRFFLKFEFMKSFPQGHRFSSLRSA